MSIFRVAFIGCGRPFKTEGATGYGMSHQHARGYRASPDCRIVALADLNLENARAFQVEHGGDTLYTDYHEMLSQEHPDIVSVCTWPHLHAQMVIDCAEAGVRAIHCEKPLAPTFGEAKRMVRVCQEHGVQLTFNHQRRFGEPFRKAKELLQAGAVGQLLRLEATTSNLMDWGTHWFDMLFFYNDETPVEWVIGQIEPRGSKKVFGLPCEGQGLAYWKFRNGVYGWMVTGFGAQPAAQHRLIGSEGIIEVGAVDGTYLRMWAKGQSDWQTVPCAEGLHGDEYVKRAILDLVDALKNGREPELAGRKAIQAAELTFATYESSRRRGRVELPLQIEDSPFLAMLASGEMSADM